MSPHARLSFIPAGFLSSGVDLTVHLASCFFQLYQVQHQKEQRGRPACACHHSCSPFFFLSSAPISPPWTFELKLCFFRYWSQTVLPLVIRALAHVTVICLFSSQLTSYTSFDCISSCWVLKFLSVYQGQAYLPRSMDKTSWKEARKVV